MALTEIKKYLEAKEEGYRDKEIKDFHRADGPSRTSPMGAADITGCSRDGTLVAIECKIKPKKPRTLQEAFLNEVRRRGGIGLVAYSLDDIINEPNLN